MAKIKLFYDRRKLTKKGYPVKIAIRSGSARADVSTGVFVEEQYWDEDEEQRHVVSRCPMSKILNEKINKKYAEVMSRFYALGENSINMTASEIKEAITVKRVKQDDRVYFYDEAEKYMDSRVGYKTKQSYGYTIGKMKLFFGNKRLQFEDITYNSLRDFEDWLRDSGAGVNTRAIHLRNIRAIFNNCLDKDIIKMDLYPFRRIKIPYEQRQKECLNAAQVKALAKMELPSESMRMARDYFMLSFYLCGANPIDLYYMEPEKNGKVTFVRRKMQTRQADKVIISLQPEARTIIDRYKGRERLLLFEEKYSDYYSFYKFIDKKIDKIKCLLGCENMTLYWARYSWATIADSLDIPERTISKALGHADKTLTERAYIAFNWDKVDKANRTVIDHVFKS